MELREQRVEVQPGVSVATWLLNHQSTAGLPEDRGTFLLVHGLASNAKLWDATALDLASGGHVVAAVDLRGHGESDKPDDGYDFGTLVSDIRKVVDQLELRNPILAGQSMGANLVLDAAWRDPDSTRGIVCVDGGAIELSGAFPDWKNAAKALAPPELIGTPEKAMIELMRKGHPTWPESGIESTMANFEIRTDGTIAPRLSRENHMKILRSLWEDRPSVKFPTLRVPALFVFAGGSNAGPPGKRKSAEDARRLIPVAQVCWFQGADHDIHAQYPRQLAYLLDSRVRSGFFSQSPIERKPAG
jgi:pimeloyl-ACP methyl ester carboxylesterase